MSFPLFVIYFVINCAFLIWGLINEDKLIAFEQKLVKKIRRRIFDSARKKRLSVVKPETVNGKGENDSFRGYVA